MASFSSNTALANLSNVRFKRIERTSSGQNFEYENFAAYKQAGGTAASLTSWDGSDAKWLRADREGKGQGCNPSRWRRAVVAIIQNQLPDRLQPFEQVADFYHYTQVLLDVRRHKIKWIYGAYHLVNELADLYHIWIKINDLNPLSNYTPTHFKNLIILLKELNVGIANFAVKQFYRLIFGEFKSLPQQGMDAWRFDEQFVIQEQRDVAFPIYQSHSGSKELDLQNDIFNHQGVFIFAPDILYLPVYADQYDSNLTNSSPTSRFGQQARIQIPLAMLYPNEKFFNDVQVSSENDENFSNTKFGKTLKRGFQKSRSSKYVDRDVTIWFAYYLTNGSLMAYFKMKHVR